MLDEQDGVILFKRFQQLDDLRQNRAAARRPRQHRDGLPDIGRAGDDRISRADRLGYGFSVNQGSFDTGLAFEHDAIDADALARRDQNHVARAHRPGGHGLHASVLAAHMHWQCRQRHQLLDGGTRLGTGAMVEKAPEQQDRQQHQRAVEIDIDPAQCRLHETHDRGQQHAERNRYVHVRATAPQYHPGRAIEVPAGIGDGG